jgi:chaperonin GroES
MANVKIRPLHDRVIVQRIEEETKTAGGIYLPDSAKEKPVRGKVIAVGTGKLLENGDVRPLDVKIGNEVLFGKYAGQEVKVDDTDYLVMREEDIMGIIEA